MNSCSSLDYARGNKSFIFFNDLCNPIKNTFVNLRFLCKCFRSYRIYNSLLLEWTALNTGIYLHFKSLWTHVIAANNYWNFFSSAKDFTIYLSNVITGVLRSPGSNFCDYIYISKLAKWWRVIFLQLIQQISVSTAPYIVRLTTSTVVLAHSF